MDTAVVCSGRKRPRTRMASASRCPTSDVRRRRRRTRHQEVIGGPDGTVTNEASLASPLRAGLRLGGDLTDPPVVFGAPTEPVRANAKAPPALWTGALCSSARISAVGLSGLRMDLVPIRDCP